MGSVGWDRASLARPVTDPGGGTLLRGPALRRRLGL